MSAGECRPIDTYAEVLRYMERPPAWAALCVPWAPGGGGGGAGPLLRNSEAAGPHYCHYAPEVEAEPPRHRSGDLPHTLLCHDMANGYHDDSFIEGTNNSDAYNFYDWAGIDIFCYFSHHFVTIPPLAWINVAHRHGVKVMGTIITEWTEGALLWNKILAAPERYTEFADILVAITKYFKFEGWLLNIENKIARPHVLVEFVRYFHEQLHAAIPGAVLIWYDSVTINGELIWQNALNENNIDYFKVCDGIFTNYTWTEANVASSATLAAIEDRVHDVYIGIDVWGRNFYSGGQFNTAEALKVAHRNGCSLAIFAPAWTHEAIDLAELYPNLGTDLTAGEQKPFFQHFLLRDKALWDSLWPYLNTRVAMQLPFRTSFCRGQGPNKRLLGQIVGADPWYNLREMEFQPNTSHGPHAYRIIKAESNLGKSGNSIEMTNTNTQIRQNQISVNKVQIPKVDSVGKTHNAIVNKSDATRNVTANDLIENITESQTTRSVTESESIKKVSKIDLSQNVTKEITKTDVSKNSTESHAAKKSAQIDDSKNKKGFKFIEKIKNTFSRTFKRRRYSDRTDTNGETTAAPVSVPIDVGTERVLRIEMDENAAPNRDAVNDDETENYDELDEDESNLAQKIDPDKIDKALSTLERVKFYAEIAQKSVSALDVSKSHAEIAVKSEMSLPALKQINSKTEKSEQHLDRVKSHARVADKPERVISATASTCSGQVCIQLKPKGDKIKHKLVVVPDERACLEYYSEDSFNGGSCLMINPSDANTDTMESRTIRLLHCEFVCENSLILYTVTKTLEGHEDQSLNVFCTMTDSAKKRFKVILLGTDVHMPQKNVSTQTHCIRYGVQFDRFPATGEQLKDVQKYLLSARPGFYVPTEDVNRWKVRYYVIDFANTTLTSISCQTGVPQGAILLGQMGVCPQ